jgi:WD40 repeat protein
MKLLAFLVLLLLTSLKHSLAQPPVQPKLHWTLKAGNPTVIEPPAEWSGHLSSVTFSPDGAMFATTGMQWPQENTPGRGVIFLWDARSGESRGELRGHDGVVQNLAWSPDGKFLATGSSDGALFVWEADTRAIRHRLSEPRKKRGREESLAPPRLQIGAWSPDSRTLVAYESNMDTAENSASYQYTIKIFDAISGQMTRVLAARAGFLSQVGWTADGKNLVVAVPQVQKGKLAGSVIEFLDIQGGEVVRRVAENEGDDFVAALSYDATRALITRTDRGANGKGPVTGINVLWDLENDRAMWTHTVSRDPIMGIKFSADSKTLVVGGADGEITLRNVATGAVSQSLPSLGCSAVETVAISPDASRIISLEGGSSSIHLWKLDEALPNPRYASQTIMREIGNVRALSWNRDSVRVVTEVSGEAKGLRVGRQLRVDTWDAATGTVETRSIAENRLMSAGVISPDGNLLAIELGTQPEPVVFATVGVGIYDLREGKLLRVLPAETSVSSMIWSPDSETLATNFYHSSVTLWDVATGAARSELKVKASVVAWSSDGKMLAMGSGDQRVRVVDAASGIEIKSWETPGAVRALAFSPDNKGVAVGVTSQANTEFAESSVQIFDVSTGKEGKTFGTQAVLRDLRWTPDGTGVGVSSLPDVNRAFNGQLRVWDVATGEERIAINDHCGMESFDFSKDGTRVATHNRDRIRVWNLK